MESADFIIRSYITPGTTLIIPDKFIKIFANICYQNIEYTDVGSLEFILT
jgi:hypothetical protein